MDELTRLHAEEYDELPLAEKLKPYTPRRQKMMGLLIAALNKKEREELKMEVKAQDLPRLKKSIEECWADPVKSGVPGPSEEFHQVRVSCDYEWFMDELKKKMSDEAVKEMEDSAEILLSLYRGNKELDPWKGVFLK